MCKVVAKAFYNVFVHLFHQKHIVFYPKADLPPSCFLWKNKREIFTSVFTRSPCPLLCSFLKLSESERLLSILIPEETFIFVLMHPHDPPAAKTVPPLSSSNDSSCNWESIAWIFCHCTYTQWTAVQVNSNGCLLLLQSGIFDY